MALLNVNFFSEAVGMGMQMEVILPERTRGQIGMQGNRTPDKIPALYLLHGMSDDHTAWIRRTSIERYVSEMGIAVIMPSTHLGWYTDMAYGNRYWTFLSDELPRICHSFFADLSEEREDTFAAGLSMGGYGALKLGLGTDRFGAVASLSGAVGIARRKSDDIQRSHYWQGIFGDPSQARDSKNDLYRLAADQSAKALREREENEQNSENEKRLCLGKGEELPETGKLPKAGKLPKIFMCCGTEDFLLQENREFKRYLTNCGYDLTYEESPGTHEWGYWDAKIQRVLQWLPIRREG